MKRQMLITSEFLQALMSNAEYSALIKSIIQRSKHEDYEEIREGEPIWLLAEW